MPSKIVTMDPGLRRVGYAVWSESGILLSAGLVTCDHEPGTERAQKWKDMGEWVNIVVGLDRLDILLVSEIPQVYEGPQAEDRNDLVDLAGVVGACAAHVMGSVEWSPTPREWKGQLTKEISRKRVEAKLSAEEKKLIKWPAKALMHNVYDALHLGLVYLEREGIRLSLKNA